MIGERTEQCIIDAVNEERKHCIESYGEFHNHHEGWAVLREEVQEVMECFIPLQGVLGENMDKLWDFIRFDIMEDRNAEDTVEQIYREVEELTKECIQVMAVCLKWMRLINKECANNE